MITSMITSKGQTTIPKNIREKLGLSRHDRIAYEVEKERVYLKPLKGTIFDLRGSVQATQKPENFKAARRSARKRAGTSRP